MLTKPDNGNAVDVPCGGKFEELAGVTVTGSTYAEQGVQPASLSQSPS